MIGGRGGDGVPTTTPPLPFKRRHWHTGLLVGLSVAVLAVAGLLAWRLLPVGGVLPVAQPREDLLNQLHAACVQDMIASTCKVMGTGSAGITAKPGELVFVAGVGAIDAVDYQNIYAAGDAMCSVVRDACTKDWAGGQCLTARRIYRL